MSILAAVAGSIHDGSENSKEIQENINIIETLLEEKFNNFIARIEARQCTETTIGTMFIYNQKKKIHITTKKTGTVGDNAKKIADDFKSSDCNEEIANLIEIGANEALKTYNGDSEGEENFSFVISDLNTVSMVFTFTFVSQCNSKRMKDYMDFACISGYAEVAIDARKTNPYVLRTILGGCLQGTPEEKEQRFEKIKAVLEKEMMNSSGNQATAS